eukprot:TRINITY_DN4575_c0_g2_i1.p2 TRINITY_DN4575_c0_g2~~TRINITY_DN4575_c0_g2_i1.p2  ORF type:complete len:125 (+),score=65.25 TRINITY_DN4575_c0_g2_i1:67-441(+)
MGCCSSQPAQNAKAAKPQEKPQARELPAAAEPQAAPEQEQAVEQTAEQKRELDYVKALVSCTDGNKAYLNALVGPLQPEAAAEEDDVTAGAGLKLLAASVGSSSGAEEEGVVKGAGVSLLEKAA